MLLQSGVQCRRHIYGAKSVPVVLCGCRPSWVMSCSVMGVYCDCLKALASVAAGFCCEREIPRTSLFSPLLLLLQAVLWLLEEPPLSLPLQSCAGVAVLLGDASASSVLLCGLPFASAASEGAMNVVVTTAVALRLPLRSAKLLCEMRVASCSEVRDACLGSARKKVLRRTGASVRGACADCQMRGTGDFV